MISYMTIVYTILTIFLIPATITVWNYIQWYRNVRRIGHQVDKIPGPDRNWLTGNITQIPMPSEKQLEWHLEQTKKYKTKYSYWFGPFRPAVVLCHPSTVKLLTKTAEPKPFSGKGGYALLKDWLGLGLLLSGGKSWFRNRRLLTPGFHFDVLKPYVKVYNEATDIFIENIGKGLSPGQDCGTSIEIFSPVSLCTLNVMMRCAFSCDDDIQRQGDSHMYVKSVRNLAKYFIERVFNPLLYSDTIYYKTSTGKKWLENCDYAHNVAYELINKRKFTLNTEGTNPTSKRAIDFLDILLLAKDDNGEGLSDLEIRQEVDTFLFEGHDTTASGLAWCLYNLASHPGYQDKARREVDELLEGRDCNHIEWDDLNCLPYLTMCIKESLRHTPPVPIVGRELENPLEIEGVTLEPGTFVDIFIYNVHHNADVWGDDHMEYKPDRFHPDKVRNMDSHAFIPFSAGPRNCIGQNFAMNEMKIFVARVLHRYILQEDPNRMPERRPEVVMQAMNGLYLILKDRNN